MNKMNRECIIFGSADSIIHDDHGFHRICAINAQNTDHRICFASWQCSPSYGNSNCQSKSWKSNCWSNSDLNLRFSLIRHTVQNLTPPVTTIFLYHLCMRCILTCTDEEIKHVLHSGFRYIICTWHHKGHELKWQTCCQAKRLLWIMTMHLLLCLLHKIALNFWFSPNVFNAVSCFVSFVHHKKNEHTMGKTVLPLHCLIYKPT